MARPIDAEKSKREVVTLKIDRELRAKAESYLAFVKQETGKHKSFSDLVNEALTMTLNADAHSNPNELQLKIKQEEQQVFSAKQELTRHEQEVHALTARLEALSSFQARFKEDYESIEAQALAAISRAEDYARKVEVANVWAGIMRRQGHMQVTTELLLGKLAEKEDVSKRHYG